MKFKLTENKRMHCCPFTWPTNNILYDSQSSKGRYVFSWGGGRAGVSEGRVISESEHQKGRAIPHVSYSR